MKIEIGRTIPDGKPVRLDVEKLIDSRALVEANSGGGKSWVFRLIAEAAAASIQTIILDPEGEFSTLREKLDMVLVGQQGELQAEPRSAALLARKLVEIRVSAVIDLYDLKLPQRRQFVRQFLDSLINVPRSLWHPLIVMLDETHIFCPEKSAGESEATGSVIDLMSQGRKRGFCGILATQRLSKLHKDAAAEANNILIGRTWLDNDQQRAGDLLGMSKAERSNLRDLAAGEFFGFGPAFNIGGVVLFKTNAVQTTHPKAGQRHKLTPPKASEAVKQIAAQLADLPQQAEAEIKSMDDAKRRIKELEREARQRPMVEKPVEKIKTIEVNVVGNAEVKQLKYAIGTLAKLSEKTEKQIERLESQKAIVSKSIGDLDETGKMFRATAAGIENKLNAAHKNGEPYIPSRQLQPRISTVNVDTGSRQTVARAVERPSIPVSSAELSGELPPGPKKALAALIQFPGGLRREQVGAIIGYRATSRNQFLKQLVHNGFAEKDSDDKFSATERGRQALPEFEELPTGDALREYWMKRLPEGPSKLLKILIDAYPESLPRDSLGEAIGYKATSRNQFIKQLLLSRLIEQAGRGAVRASANLFDVEAAR